MNKSAEYSLFENYIFNRIKKTAYRGYHISQHNRLPFDKVKTILEVIHKYAEEEKFIIHIGDYKGKKQKDARLYYEIVNELNQKLGQITINSLKKNIFPDLHRMGLIERYDKNDLPLDPYRRSIVHKVKLSEQSLYFLQSSIKEQYKIYINAIEKIVPEHLLNELFELLYNKFETISVFEYMLIVSDSTINTADKIKLIEAYRQLKKHKQITILSTIKTYCEQINKQSQNKTQKRDFGNWYNEALQTFNILNQTVYFKTFRKTTLMLGLSQEGLEFLITRSQKQKDEYFKWHQIAPNKGYELHHIVPISYATSKKQLERVDHYKNLIYIQSKTHKKIPKQNNYYIKLTQHNQSVFIVNPDNPDDKINITEAILIKATNLKDMIQYNIDLLERI